jgi:FkbM family methyltransferase
MQKLQRRCAICCSDVHATVCEGQRSSWGIHSMARKIFIDVGGHEGQSARAALDASLAFDEVHSFEPHPVFAAIIRSIGDARLHVNEAALSSRNGELRLSGDNTHGGATVLNIATRGDVHTVISIDILDYLNQFEETDIVFIKVNCEGGEVAIIERLCATKARPTIRSIAVDFDVVKSPWGYWKKRATIRMARQAGVPILLYEDVMVKNAGGGIANWLDLYPHDFPLRRGRNHIRQPLKRKLRYGLRDLRSALGLTVTWRH